MDRLNDYYYLSIPQIERIRLTIIDDGFYTYCCYNNNNNNNKYNHYFGYITTKFDYEWASVGVALIYITFFDILYFLKISSLEGKNGLFITILLSESDSFVSEWYILLLDDEFCVAMCLFVSILSKLIFEIVLVVDFYVDTEVLNLVCIMLSIWWIYLVIGLSKERCESFHSIFLSWLIISSSRWSFVGLDGQIPSLNFSCSGDPKSK